MNADPWQHELSRRMSRPQRHRLLQGYPMLPLMQPALPQHPLVNLRLDPTRRLIVGVLPHPFCNPKVRGCGFCTFPHERFGKTAMAAMGAKVLRELDRAVELNPALSGRRVDALYFGGGTANLTPPDQLRALGERVARMFDCSDAEVSLEGVPRYFLLDGEAQLEVLQGLPVAHRRISMGVQTFDPAWLKRMGRDAFGGREEIGRVVRAAHARGFTASADLLFNLPGAGLEAALEDIRIAIELGLDQICTYNLVLTRELDTEWAKDEALVGAMLPPQKALETWLAVREALLAAGYQQTTLTNFERGDRRFLYERASFDPASYDALGFGPAGISTVTIGRWAVKWVNAMGSEAYAGMPERVFDYHGEDLRLLHLTRQLSALRVDAQAYRAFFGTDAVADFSQAFAAIEAAGLIEVPGLKLTPKGMFYADAVAGLLAHRRVKRDDRVLHHSMG